MCVLEKYNREKSSVEVNMLKRTQLDSALDLLAQRFAHIFKVRFCFSKLCIPVI